MSTLRYLLGAMILAGCASAPPKPPPPLVTPVPNSTCDTACTNLHELGCRTDVPTCVKFCKRVVDSMYLKLELDCAVGARSVVELSSCGITCMLQ